MRKEIHQVYKYGRYDVSMVLLEHEIKQNFTLIKHSCTSAAEYGLSTHDTIAFINIARACFHTDMGNFILKQF